MPFKVAWQVFIEDTLPGFYKQTQSIYPSLENLPLLCRSVLVSIVFNRGTDLRGDRRKEMKEIQSLLLQADKTGQNKTQVNRTLAGVEEQIVSMKRLWSPNSGLFKRRQSEANLWRAGLEDRM